MAFDNSHFSSVNNQQCAGERIQTWQYETTDPIEDLIAANYFAPARQSLSTNDLIWVILMDGDRKTALGRYNLTVRVNGSSGGTNLPAIVALPELADATTTMLEFTDLSATATLPLPVTATATSIVGAYAVLLGSLDAPSSLAIAVKSSDATPKTVYSGKLDGPAVFGAELTLTAGTADTDTAYSVTVTPTSVPASAGKLVLFLQTKAA